MRDYGRVHSTFWSSQNIRAMSEDARTLAFYLLTSPHTTIVGAFRLPDGYVCEDLQWSTERVSKGFCELSANGYANRCETTKWVWIRKFLEWNSPENPNQWKAARKISASVPEECLWRDEFVEVLSDFDEEETEPSGNPSATLSKSGSGSGTETKKEIALPVVEGLNPQAWSEWFTYRKTNKPLRPTSITKAQRALAKFGEQQQTVVDHSIANGYQGLFAPRANDKPKGKSEWM